ncbi:M15 family metallopeptidase [Microbacterium sp. CIAB417]|uniref:M15 family metallopeptidase n=1 Tax=Microbacterium sp. CIAB417 TaxID=2860287 RepID=UPI001FABD26B|nr:M15 family metallopeptidase [Microbacterium sp. CIAB417]
MSEATAPRHAAPRPRTLAIALPIGVAVTAIGALWALADVPAPAPVEQPVPAVALHLPPVDVEATVAVDPCAEAAVQDAVASGDDAATIAAFGGGEAFRAAVAAGNAPCISLTDPDRIWVVVNKARPLDADFTPTGLVDTALQTTTTAGSMRAEATEAIDALAGALSDAGAGRLGMNNGYRSYGMQQNTYRQHVAATGQNAADEVSARPGYSEHQTGLALDVVSCGNGCGGIHDFGGTRESDWVSEHAWEYGYIVRYLDGETSVTGYSPEPWHLRYIGPELAAAYHAGGYTTLEEFFGLPAAPDYAG